MIKDNRLRVGGGKIYVGCGPDVKEGFVGCDIRPLENVDIVCKAWKISEKCYDVDEIFSRHMLEHLTASEVEVTLRDWYKSLKIGGEVHIVVPNMDFHVKQWLNAVWDDESLDKWSDAQWGTASIYGWQRECDPSKEDYNNDYWDVHKSGYNTKKMTFLLSKIGFEQVNVYVQDDVHLVAKAVKPNVNPSVEGIYDQIDLFKQNFEKNFSKLIHKYHNLLVFRTFSINYFTSLCDVLKKLEPKNDVNVVCDTNSESLVKSFGFNVIPKNDLVEQNYDAVLICYNGTNLASYLHILRNVQRVNYQDVIFVDQSGEMSLIVDLDNLIADIENYKKIKSEYRELQYKYGSRTFLADSLEC